MNVSEEEAVLLEKEGLTEVKPMARLSLRLRLHHALFGCTTIRKYVLNTNIGRAIEVGRICPLCFKEYPVR